MTSNELDTTSAPPISSAELTSRLNIVTMRWGDRYSSAHVNRLYHQTQRFGLARSSFHCFTDDPTGLHANIIPHELPEIDLPEPYRWTNRRKISLFREDLPISGPCLYFDVDSIVIGPVEPLLRNWSGKPRFLRTFSGAKTKRMDKHDGINSSLMLFEAGSCPQVMARFEAEKQQVLETWPSDQGFIHSCLSDQCEYFPEGLCASFKKHCIPRFPFNLLMEPQPPKGAVALFFHGRPDPDEARVGFRGNKAKRHCRPTRWIEPPIEAHA
jgi:hypothetical protein